MFLLLLSTSDHQDRQFSLLFPRPIQKQKENVRLFFSLLCRVPSARHFTFFISGDEVFMAMLAYLRCLPSLQLCAARVYVAVGTVRRDVGREGWCREGI